MNNAIPLFSNPLWVVVAAIGVACILLSVLYSIRYPLGILLDQLSGKGWVVPCLAVLVVFGLTRFAGAKHGSPTNDPPGGIGGGSSATNDPPPTLTLILPQTEGEQFLSPPSPAFSACHTLSNWHARGAWSDWTRISFPSDFRFPLGTNFIYALTLMANGEIRSPHHALTTNGQYRTATLAALPQAVSVEPCVTAVSYGLTSSNTLRFVWENACVERNPTNRVDAAIELFRSGTIAITTQPTNRQPATVCQSPFLPDGFIGYGQDEAWIRATFPEEATNILARGYANWLDDWVGVDVQNGHYKAEVTVAALPSDGSPCYLVCGPFKVNVVEPGTYLFPLEVYVEYPTRTYPEAIPLAFDCDDGYTGTQKSYDFTTNQTPPLLMAAGPLMTMSLPASVQNAFIYVLKMIPYVVVTPDHMTPEEANGAHIRVWCNVREIRRDFRATVQGARILFGLVDDVELKNIMYEGYIDFMIESNFATAEGRLLIERLYPSRAAEHAFIGEPLHVVSSNGWTITHMSVDSCESSQSFDIHLQSNGVYYVAVYMATKEDIFVNGVYYNDTVSWNVTAGETTVAAGSADVAGHVYGFQGAYDIASFTYGMVTESVHVGGGIHSVSTSGISTLHVAISATDVLDNLEHTAVQVVVYPVDDDGTILALPDWVSLMY